MTNHPPKFVRLVVYRLALGLTTATAVFTPFSHVQAQFYSWQGPGTDPSAGANYNGGVAPTLGTTNADSVLTLAGANDFNYNSSLTTTYGNATGGLSGLFWQAAPSAFGAPSGGTANTSNVNVTAGTVNLNGAFVNDGGTESLWVGNGGSFANFTVNGGTVSILNGTLLGRDGATGTLSVSNGSFSTGRLNSSYGVIIGGSATALGGGNTGAGKVTIGNGGHFSLTGAASEPISFGGLVASTINSTSDFFNFTTGSTGTLSLNLTAISGTYASPLVYLQNLVSNGYIQINRVTATTLSSFTFNTTTPGVSALGIAAVPEPRQYAIAIPALMTLVILARRRRSA